MNQRVTGLLAGMLVGSAVSGLGLYLLDPVSGRNRRTAIRDRLGDTARQFDVGRQKVRAFSARAQRAAGDAASRFATDKTTDEYLMRRVRAAVAATVSQPETIGVWARQGRVLLHGEVLQEEHEPLLRRIRALANVGELSDQLNKRDPADRIWTLRGSHVPQRARWFAPGRARWSPTARVVAACLGLGSLAMGIRERRSLLAIPAGLAGAALLVRSGVNRPFRRLTPGRGVIDVHGSVEIDAPIERVFGFLEDFEHFPVFMRNIRSVTRHEDGSSHWIAEGPGGSPIEWDAIVTVHRPGELLAWRSLPESDGEHTGVIRFEPLGDQRTLVEIRMSYSPPAGVLGHAFARVLGLDPGTSLRHDLLRAKRAIEAWSSAGGRMAPGRSGYATDPARAAAQNASRTGPQSEFQAAS